MTQGCPEGGIKRVCGTNRKERSGDALCFMVKTWTGHNTTEALLTNGWRLAVSGWWQLAVAGSWRLVAVGGSRLVVGGG